MLGGINRVGASTPRVDGTSGVRAEAHARPEAHVRPDGQDGAPGGAGALADISQAGRAAASDAPLDPARDVRYLFEQGLAFIELARRAQATRRDTAGQAVAAESRQAAMPAGVARAQAVAAASVLRSALA